MFGIFRKIKYELSIGNIDSICPYCNSILEKRPSKKTKCIYCNKDIYVKIRPSDKQKILVSEKDALAVDWMYKIKNYNITFELIEEIYQDMLKNKGKNFSYSDAIRSIFNGVLLSNCKDYGEYKMLYYDMALFLHDEGKDPYNLLKQVHKFDLLDLKKSGVIKKVEILTAGDGSCFNCNKKKGMILTIDEALSSSPLPCKECQHKINMNSDFGFCRCVYLPIVE